MQTTVYEALEHQADFLESESIHTGLVGGFRSGKSEAGVLKTVAKKLKYPGIDVAYYMPTYSLIKLIAYPKFSKMLDRLGVKYVLNKSDHEYTTAFGKIILRSMDNPDLIIGYEVGYSLIDEADILPAKHMEDVFTKAVARLSVPLPDGKANCLDFVSTPEGFKFMYDFFVKKPSQAKTLIRARTANNPYISETYISTLKESYSPEQLEAYLEGEFVNLTTGTVHKNYDRTKNNTRRVVQPKDVLHVGMDFNITKMNAVIHVEEDGKKFAVDEIHNAYDTAEVCEILKKRYGDHKIIIYPDAAGKARSTSGKSDHQIIRSFKFIIRAPVQNPFVKDRVNKMNQAFLNRGGERNYLVNDEQCPNYAEALEKQTYKNGVPDKIQGYDHINEAAGYYISFTSIGKIKYGLS